MSDLYSLIIGHDLIRLQEFLESLENCPDYFGSLEEYPLGIAVCNQNLDAVKMLLNFGADPNYPSLHYGLFTLLELSEDTTMLEELLRSGASPLCETCSDDDYGSLHHFAEEGNCQFVKLIIESLSVNLRKLALNKSDDRGYTPLMYAIEGNHNELAQFLIEAGSNVNHLDVDRIGVTPLCVAVRVRNGTLARILVQCGADKDLCVGLSFSAQMLSELVFPEMLAHLGSDEDSANCRSDATP